MRVALSCSLLGNTSCMRGAEGQFSYHAMLRPTPQGPGSLRSPARGEAAKRIWETLKHSVNNAGQPQVQRL
jgi:hypothetical protein